MTTYLFERNFNFTHGLMARFINTRCLTCGPDKQTGEQIRQCRMVMPVRNHAGQQIGATQEGRIIWCCTAENKMVAATRTSMPAIHHELLRGQSRLMCRIVEEGRVLCQLM